MLAVNWNVIVNHALQLDDLNEEEDETELQGQFDSILEDLEAYVQPLAGLLDIDIRYVWSFTLHLNVYVKLALHMYK